MLDPALTEDDIQRTLADLTTTDEALGGLASDAWIALTAGEGPSMLSLAGLQTWVWWLLPKRSHSHDDFDHEYWASSAAAAAALFDRLDATAYASVCRSDTTASVLAAWRVSRSKGAAATRKALKASPVTPPDLDDFVWGNVFGAWESSALSAVEAALEAALGSGRLEPGRARWRDTAREVCAETLDGERPGDIGQSWRSLVLSERAEAWATGPPTPPGRQAERQDIAAAHLSPPPLPDDAVTAGPLGLLGWLADVCADGVTLTGTGYLPRSLVLEAVEHHNWREWGAPPRSEADVFQLRVVHSAARKLKVLRRKGRTLTTTKAGRTVATEPERWWPQLVMLGHGEVVYRDAIFEALALALSDAEEHAVDRLQNSIGHALAAQGWRTNGQPVNAIEHGHSLYMAINPWRIWGFVDYQSAFFEPGADGPERIRETTVTATPAGLAAGALWLHRHITGPRRDI